MEIGTVRATDLFVGAEHAPRQVVRVSLLGQRAADVRVSVRGARVLTPEEALVERGSEAEVTADVGIVVDDDVVEGTVLDAEVVASSEHETVQRAVQIAAAEPGWRMFMVSHFHYDPVWWNTQASYTESWKRAGVGDEQPWVRPFQQPGFTLVKAHLDMARRDPDYTFVLAELDYLKPYWDVFCEDRTYLRQLMADGRLELMGGTYNEPNTNLTAAETTARNAVYGVGYQRDVLGGTPATAWQLDVFGHDPQFPGIMADAGLSSSSWARGPFHEWGPRWNRGPDPVDPPSGCDDATMQFASEFEWMSPSGRALLTSYMANHYSAGWWMDSAATLADAERETYRLFTELKEVAATKNVLLPAGTDYSPPNKWVTQIQRDWNARYVWPKFVSATPSEFFATARAEMAAAGSHFAPQTRDMNPVYSGKDVSYIDTKQAQRQAENTLLAAEKFATVAALLSARYPTEAIDKAWRQLLFGAHHDGITGSESDQVYLDLLGGWREALELSQEALNGALAHIGAHIDTTGDGMAVTVFNPLAWDRTDVARVELHVDALHTVGVRLQDEAGADVPFVVERVDRHEDGVLAGLALAFIAAGVPPLGYRTYRVLPADELAPSPSWSRQEGSAIENDRYRVEVAADRGGAIARLVDKEAGKELLRPGALGNEVLAYGEYGEHPRFKEGPWHLTPNGTMTSSADGSAEVVVEHAAIGQRIRARGAVAGCRLTQEITLWDGADRVELRTHLDDFGGQDTLFRVRFAADVSGGAPVSEVGNAVIGRGFGFPNVDVAQVPYTLDNPAYNWFALSTTARVVVADGDAPHAARAIGVAEVIVGEDATGADSTIAVVTALVRAGVTATVSADTATRYGCIALDSNLPDVRIAIGDPASNRFIQQVLQAAGAPYVDELNRQLEAHGSARVWVPADRPLREVWQPNADLRGVRDLPVLIVAGGDRTAVDALTHDLDDAVIEVNQPAHLDEQTGTVEDYSVAVLNRGMPGFNVESDGTMYLSLMRSCSGWPSGIWIDPPRRTAPDGSNFQFQHWSHTFDYALVGRAGDWRTAEVVRAGHDYNNPLEVRVLGAHEGPLPAAAGLLEVAPSNVVCTALKPTGHPMAKMAGTATHPADGITLRLYETTGRPTRATVRFAPGLREGFRTDLLEERRTALPVTDGVLQVDLDGYEIATVSGVPEGFPDVAAGGQPAGLARRVEAAQPVFSDYWMHNRGVAPLGYQPVTVQIRPASLRVSEAFTVPVTVASERTDGPMAGHVELAVPSGWKAEPPERIYRLEPGAYMSFDALVTPPDDTTSGRYFVAARITDEAGQVHEDVVTIDYGEPPEWDIAAANPGTDSLILDRMNLKARVVEGEGSQWPRLGGELEAELATNAIRVLPGTRAELAVRLRNKAASPVHGEAQILSPYETWPMVTPWTKGFAVDPGADDVLAFAIDIPPGGRPGRYWALVKLMYFGRMIYTEAVPVVIDQDSA